MWNLVLTLSEEHRLGVLREVFGPGREKYNRRMEETAQGASSDLVTYLLTPWSRVLLEKLTGSQPVKKLLSFYGTRKFITAFTSARHVSIS